MRVLMAWRKTGYGLALLLALVVWTGNAWAAPAAASDLEQAITFYRQGAYPEAGRLLEKVTRQEPQNGAAHFFAGLTMQAQGNYVASIPSFQAAMRHDREFAQLATYQIGLAQHKTGQRQEAMTTLRQAVAMDPNSDAGKNARTLLDTVERQGGAAAKPWHLRLGAGIEYDDNITVEEQELATDQSDFATVLELEGGYRVTVPKPYQVELSYSLYQSLYDDYSQFDLQTHTVGLAGSRDFDGWDAGLSYAYSYMFLGREGFLQSHRLTPNAGFFLPHGIYATVNYTLEDKDFRKTADNGRDAVNQAVGGDLFAFFLENRGYVQLGYRLEGENASAAEYDYWGHTLVVAVQVPAWYETKARLSLKYQDREYRHITPSIGAERDDTKQTEGFMVSRRFLERYEAKVEYQHIDSDSNLESSDYSENILFAAVSAAF